MFKKITTIPFFILVILASTSIITYARVDILPQKVVMGPRDRSADVTILNMYDQSSLYRMSVINYRQNEEGVYQKLEAPLNPAFNPEQHVRISPKQFTVAPGGRQKIRLSLRKPDNLPEAEYRFHLLATRFPSQDDDKGEQEGMNISIKMNVGVAIPVVVRHGELNVESTIENAGFTVSNEREVMAVKIKRSGTASAIGKLEIYWQPEGGKVVRIGQIKNMNIFTEINERTVIVPLRQKPQGPGVIKVSYFDDDGNAFDEKFIRQ